MPRHDPIEPHDRCERRERFGTPGRALRKLQTDGHNRAPFQARGARRRAEDSPCLPAQARGAGGGTRAREAIGATRAVEALLAAGQSDLQLVQSRPDVLARRLVIPTLVLAALFGLGYVISRGQANSGLFLTMALILLGVAIIFSFVAGAQQVGAAALRRSGRSGRDAAVAGLLIISLLAPWSLEIKLADVGQAAGWSSPLAWVALVGTGIFIIPRLRPFRALGLASSGVALVTWVLWLGWLLTRPQFHGLGFPFIPIDLLAVGWYASLLSWVIAVDGLAIERATERGPVTPQGVWGFAVVPGLGLVRLGLAARGRLWLLAAIGVIALLQGVATDPQELAFYAFYGGTPPVRWRGIVIILLAGLLVIYAGSLWDTWRVLTREQSRGGLRLLSGGKDAPTSDSARHEGP